MKKYFLLPAIVFIAACNGGKGDSNDKDTSLLSTSLVTSPYSADPANDAELGDLPTLDFKDTTHSFGTINEGETVQYEFEFTNNGKQPLIISSAQASCGCTVADYPRQPVAAGKSGTMRVTFSSAGKQGHHEKNVTINTNTKRGVHMLHISADVTPSKTTDLPTE